MVCTTTTPSPDERIFHFMKRAAKCSNKFCSLECLRSAHIPANNVHCKVGASVGCCCVVRSLRHAYNGQFVSICWPLPRNDEHKYGEMKNKAHTNEKIEYVTVRQYNRRGQFLYILLPTLRPLFTCIVHVWRLRVARRVNADAKITTFNGALQQTNVSLFFCLHNNLIFFRPLKIRQSEMSDGNVRLTDCFSQRICHFRRNDVRTPSRTNSKNHETNFFFVFWWAVMLLSMSPARFGNSSNFRI